jgi:hypothetical protein
MNNNPEPKESEAPLRSDERQVNPAVKAWLKNVIVPAMVKQYTESKPAQCHQEERRNIGDGGTVISTVKI